MNQDALKKIVETITHRVSDEHEISTSLGTMHGPRAAYTYLSCMEVLDTLNAMSTLVMAQSPPPFVMEMMAMKASHAIASIQVAGLEGYPPQKVEEIRKIIDMQVKKRTSAMSGMIKTIMKAVKPNDEDA